MRALAWGLVVALVCAGGANGTSQQPSLIGKQAPRFVRQDLSGKRVDLAAMNGKVVLLNFWATWCAPCRIELPTFAGWQTSYGQEGFQVIAVSMDDERAPVDKAVIKLKMNFPVVMGDAKLGDDYGGVLGLPITYLIDRGGKVAARYAGESDLKQMESTMKKLLSQR